MAAAEIAPILHTPRLTLTHFSWSSPKDIETVLSAFNHPYSVAKQGDFGLHSEEDLHRWEWGAALSRNTLRAAYSKTGRPVPEDGIAPPTLPWYLIRLGAQNPSGERIGMISIMECQPLIPHIGWCLYPEHTGSGYATEAAREVLRYWREDFGVEHVLALTDPSNEGSYRIAQKLGMERNEHKLVFKGSGDRRLPDGSEGDTEMECYKTMGTLTIPRSDFVLLREEREKY